MRKLHLLLDDHNPHICRTYCGIEDDSDDLRWTYKRKQLVKDARGCKQCIELSKPEPPVPLGFAAAQLDNLEYYNQLSRNPPTIILTNLEQRIIDCLEDGTKSATLVAFHADQSVSAILSVLQQLFNKGVVTKVRKRWIAVDTPLPMCFNLVDPVSMAAGRILHRA